MPTIASGRRAQQAPPTSTTPSANPSALNPSSEDYSSNSASQTEPPPPNTSVQSMDTQFEPLDIIGTGSFGIIRKVRRLHDGLILARKELNYGRMDERDLRQLGEEVNILQNLRGNDHIVKYFERYVDKQNFMLYILMEYCSQGDLAGVISRCRRDQVHLGEDTIWSYLAQITTALLDCHSAEMTPEDGGKKKPIILHRDIKPENVFLNHFGLVKLGDFGLSKAMEMAAFTNTYVGTPYYMSPELINGQQYDVKSDIWALGCLIYELCAWHPPFHQAQTQPELAKLIREGKIPNLPRGYSSQLTALIKSMLRQDPKLRPDAKAILSVEQVKHQIRVLEVHRYARELTRKQNVIEEQEKALLERETKLKSREVKLQKDKDYFKSQQENHLLLQQEFQIKFQHALEVIERAQQIEARQQDENEAPSSDHQVLDDNASEISKPSASSNRRIPLAERRLSLNPPPQSTSSSSSSTPTVGYVSKRVSAIQQPAPSGVSSNSAPVYGSPMKLDTPFKHLAPTVEPPTPMPLPSTQGTVGSRFVRQVKSSKSLASLKTTSSFLSRLKSSEESDSVTTTSDDGPSSNSAGHAGGKKLTEKPISTTFSTRRLSRRSESANGLLNFHQQQQAASTAPAGQPPKRASNALGTASSENEAYHSSPGELMGDHLLPPPSMPASTVPPTQSSPDLQSGTFRSPKYNLMDPESLPSPFLKKKSSASTLVSNFLRTGQTNQNNPPRSPRKAHSQLVPPSRPSNIDHSSHTAPSVGARKIPTMLQHIKGGGGAPPSIAARPTGAKRISVPSATGTRASLASKFLSARDGGAGADAKKAIASAPSNNRRRESSNPSR